MHRPDGEDELKRIREDMVRLGVDIRAAFAKAAPVFKVAAEQIKMAAQNMRVGLKALGDELNKSTETREDDSEDGEKVGAKK